MPTARCFVALLTTVFLTTLVSTAGIAQDRTKDTFSAMDRCPAFQSFRKQTNPGNVSIQPGMAYALIGVNGTDPTHYRIRIPGAKPEERWVAMDCGGLVGAGDGSAAAGSGSKTPASVSDARGASALAKALGGSRSGGRIPTGRQQSGLGQRSPAGRYVLAASWHASFCELRPRSRDCRSGGYEDGFKLHGLWPQPRDNEYCGVSRRDISADREGRWRDLPEPEIAAATRRSLADAMPGVVAELHKHEWIKHGTCYGADADEYFVDALALVEKLNASPVGTLFKSSRGRELTNNQIRTAFDNGFGRGAGKRVLVDCNDDDGRDIINELQINLEGVITPSSNLGDLMMRASTAPRGCPSGIVDRSGDQ